MEKRRIIVAKGSSEEREGFFLPHAGINDVVELAEDLGEALEACLREPCDRLYVSLFSADAGELTSLAMFRAMQPAQYTVLVVDPSIRPLIEATGLADECMVFEASS